MLSPLHEIFSISEDKKDSSSDDGNVVVKKGKKERHINPLKQSVSITSITHVYGIPFIKYA